MQSVRNQKYAYYTRAYRFFKFYRQRRLKYDIYLDDEDTVSFHQDQYHTFNEVASGDHKEEDIVTVLNVPYMVSHYVISLQNNMYFKSTILYS